MKKHLALWKAILLASLLMSIVCATGLGVAQALEGSNPIIKISSNGTTFAALDDSGALYLWGDNSRGLLDIPKGLPYLRDVAVGHRFIIALDFDGKLHGWGEATDGETDFGDDLPPFIAVGAGNYYSIALTEDGDIYPFDNGGWEGKEFGKREGIPPIQRIVSGGEDTACIGYDGFVYSYWRRPGYRDIPDIEAKVKEAAIESGGVPAAITVDGTIHSELKPLTNGRLFLPMPKIENPDKIFGDYRNIAVLDKDGKLFIWGEYEHSEKMEPIVNVPTNLPPLSQVVLESFHQIVTALSVDGKVYQWNAPDYASGMAAPMPDVINGFLNTAPEFDVFAFPGHQYEAVVHSEEELFTAIQAGKRIIHCADDFTIKKRIDVRLKTLHIQRGVNITIASTHYDLEDYLQNEGTLTVSGILRIYSKETSPGLGTVVMAPRGKIDYMCAETTLDQMERIMHEDSLFNSMSVIGSKQTIVVDRDFTIPKGFTLWLNGNTKLEVMEGVTLTVLGTLDAYPDPIVHGEIVYADGSRSQW